MAAKLTRLIHKIAIQLHPVAELHHLQISLQAASPETFGYTFVLGKGEVKLFLYRIQCHIIEIYPVCKYCAMEIYEGMEVYVPHMLNLSTRWR